MKKAPKARQSKSALETQIVEDTKVLSAYGYCELPAHFFERALTLEQTGVSKPALTVASWKNGVPRSGQNR